MRLHNPIATVQGGWFPHCWIPHRDVQSSPCCKSPELSVRRLIAIERTRIRRISAGHESPLTGNTLDYR